MNTMSAVFPSGRIFAKNNNKVIVTRTIAEDSMSATFTVGGYSVTRFFGSTALPGTLIFPIDEILETVLGDLTYKDFAIHSMNVSADSILEGALENPSAIRVISGASYYPFDSETAMTLPLGFPQPKNIRIYPALLPHKIPTAIKSNASYIAMMVADYEFETVEDMELYPDFGDGEVAYVSSADSYFLVSVVGALITFAQRDGGIFNASITSQGNEAEITQTFLDKLELEGAKITIESNLSALKYHPLSYVIDQCPILSDEYYLRWLDIYGYTMYFKFKRMDIVLQSKISETVSVFDSSLSQYKKQKKTYINELQLTSNLVDSDTFDWLKRVSVASDIEIYEHGAWRKVTIDEVSLSGKNEQNAVTIKVNIDEFMPTI